MLIVQTLYAAEGNDWGYKNEDGPHNWSKINLDYHACLGHNQSPIDIKNTVTGNLDNIKFNYNLDPENIHNSPHTIQVNFKKGSYLVVEGKQFELKQFHIHSPSENTISGKQYPLEIHFVHEDLTGALAVIAILYQEGKENSVIQNFLYHIPKQGESLTLENSVDFEKLLPTSKAYYRFNGSLTTPPCTEGVRWLVFKQIETLSKSQLLAIQKNMNGPNNRPIQKQNARLIIE